MTSEAPACRAMLSEASRLWPGRNRASDGILPSVAHTIANPTSDHERGLAVDLTHDPEHGVDCEVLAEIVKRDARTKYVIFRSRIWSKDRAAEGWRRYRGSNPHDKHMHVSIRADRRHDTSPWFGRPHVPQPHTEGDRMLIRVEGTATVYEVVGSVLFYVSGEAFAARGLQHKNVRVVGKDDPLAKLKVAKV